MNSLCGKFSIISNPVQIDKWGFWQIETEDGCVLIAVPIHLYPALLDMNKITHVMPDKIYPCIDRAYHIPGSVSAYDRKVLRASKAVILACDGAYWKDTQEWGVGVLSRKPLMTNVHL